MTMLASQVWEQDIEAETGFLEGLRFIGLVESPPDYTWQCTDCPIFTGLCHWRILIGESDNIYSYTDSCPRQCDYTNLYDVWQLSGSSWIDWNPGPCTDLTYIGPTSVLEQYPIGTWGVVQAWNESEFPYVRCVLHAWVTFGSPPPPAPDFCGCVNI
jgi:hypothetical protein